MNSHPSIAVRSHLAEWPPILQLAAEEVFEIMIGCRLQPSSPLETPPHDEFTAMVGLAGALTGIITFGCGAKAASEIAVRMLGPNVATSDRQVWDALGEICNMIAGNFKNKLSGLDGRCLLSVPTVVIGAEYRFHSLTGGDALSVVLLFDGMPIIVRLELVN